jgi:hypothetical protein
MKFIKQLIYKLLGLSDRKKELLMYYDSDKSVGHVEDGVLKEKIIKGSRKWKVLKD